MTTSSNRVSFRTINNSNEDINFFLCSLWFRFWISFWFYKKPFSLSLLFLSQNTHAQIITIIIINIIVKWLCSIHHFWNMFWFIITPNGWMARYSVCDSDVLKKKFSFFQFKKNNRKMAEKSLVNVMHQWTLALPMGKSKVTDSDSFHFIKIKVSGWNFYFFFFWK